MALKVTVEYPPTLLRSQASHIPTSFFLVCRPTDSIVKTKAVKTVNSLCEDITLAMYFNCIDSCLDRGCLVGRPTFADFADAAMRPGSED